MSYEIYKILHLTGIVMILLALGGLSMHMITGGTRNNPWRMPAALTHGFGMFFALVGGFGMMARLGIHSFPSWIIIKLVIWIVFGGMMALVLRKPTCSKKLWWLCIVLFAVAAVTAIYKP